MTTAHPSIPSDPNSRKGSAFPVSQTDPTDQSASLAARQEASIAALVSMANDHAGRQTEIDDALERARTSSDERRTTARTDAETSAQTDRDRNTHDRDNRLTKLTESYEQKSAKALTAHTNARDDAIERLDSELRAAEEKLRDAAWLAEASFEGGSEQPKADAERIRGVVREEFGKLDSIEAHARRLAGPRITFPPTVPDEQRAQTDPTQDESSKDDSDAPPTEPETAAQPLSTADALANMNAARDAANKELKKLRGVTLHAFVRSGGPIVMILGGMVGGAVYHVLDAQLSDIPMTGAYALAGGVAMLVVAWPVRMLALAGTRKRIVPIAAHLREARTSGIYAVRTADAIRKQTEREISRRKQAEVDAGRSRYENRLSIVKQRREQTLTRLDRKHVVAAAALKKRRDQQIQEIETRFAERAEEIEAMLAEAFASADAEHAESIANAERAHAEARDALESECERILAHAEARTAEAREAMDAACPAWNSDAWPAGPRPTQSAPAIRIGSMRAPAPGCETSLVVPALLDTPAAASMVVRTAASGREAALDALRNATLRALTALPAGKVRLTMLDPIGLGQSFAGFMRLADHDERLVDSKIWTEARHIEQRLADLTGHMETVIQKYLRNEFPSIDAYNEKAGEIAEPYRFLVVADFPTGFTEESARRLASIIESGPRCGVFVLLHHDARGKLPETISAEDLGKGCALIEYNGAEDAHPFVWQSPAYATLPLSLESPPGESQTATILDAVGKAALESGRVEVPFKTLAPSGPASMWSEDCSGELSIPLGRAGATKLQRLALGKGTSQHALIAGKTGSGKSTLLHVMITAGALWYSPDELEFYLVDFKKGVEFKAYTGGRLPHARAVAIESDREFGLSVLHRLDDELKRRGDLFRDLGVQSIGAARDAMRSAGKQEAIPRTMLVIDEFQEFFTEDDKIAQDAGLLLDRLVRQGRAFGMHVFLGSQTLSGAYSLARSTMGQMAVRIALQCSETDSYLILSEDNAAARLLNRPGEAIYNDANGMVEGNNPFQVCWLPDAERDEMLASVRDKLAADPPVIDTHTIVFEGNIPADLADNQELAAAVGPSPAPVRAAKAWIGDPVAIKPPTGAHLRRQAGANLLLLGQQDETSRAMLTAAMVGIAGQHAIDPAGIKIAFLDSTPPDDPEAESVASVVDRLAEPGTLDIAFGRVRQMAGIIAEFDAERLRRESDDSAAHKPWYLFILGLQRFRDLRQKEDDFSFSMSGDDDDDAGANPASQLADLLRDGPALGMHVVTWCDTAASLSRTLDRRGIAQFEQRAVLQMSASDSSTIIDTPLAGRLGMNRGLLFNEELGTLEKFRPYRMPGDDLVARVASALRR